MEIIKDVSRQSKIKFGSSNVKKCDEKTVLSAKNVYNLKGHIKHYNSKVIEFSKL